MKEWRKRNQSYERTEHRRKYKREWFQKKQALYKSLHPFTKINNEEKDSKDFT